MTRRKNCTNWEKAFEESEVYGFFLVFLSRFKTAQRKSSFKCFLTAVLWEKKKIKIVKSSRNFHHVLFEIVLFWRILKFQFSHFNFIFLKLQLWFFRDFSYLVSKTFPIFFFSSMSHSNFLARSQTFFRQKTIDNFDRHFHLFTFRWTFPDANLTVC